MIYKTFSHILNNLSDLLKETVVIYLFRIISIAVAFGTNLILSNSLTVKDFGLFNYIQSWLALLLPISVLGFNQLLLRETGYLKEKENYSSLIGLFLQSIFTGIVISISLSALFMAISYINKTEVYSYEILFFLLPAYTMLILVDSTLQGLDLTLRSKLLTLIFNPIFFLASVTILSSLKLSHISFILTMKGISDATTFLLGSLILLRFFYKRTHGNFVMPSFHVFHWMSASLPLLLLGLLGVFETQGVIVITGNLGGLEDVALLAVVMKLTSFVSLALNTANAVLVPKATQIYARGEKQELVNLAVSSARIVIIMIVPLVLLIVFFGRYILNLFGEEYIVAYPALLILVCGELINAMMGSVGYMLIITRNAVISTMIRGISLFFTLLLVFMFFPIWGIVGVATASIITTLIWNILTTWFVWNKVGILVHPFQRLNRNLLKDS